MDMLCCITSNGKQSQYWRLLPVPLSINYLTLLPLLSNQTRQQQLLRSSQFHRNLESKQPPYTQPTFILTPGLWRFQEKRRSPSLSRHNKPSQSPSPCSAVLQCTERGCPPGCLSPFLPPWTLGIVYIWVYFWGPKGGERETA